MVRNSQKSEKQYIYIYIKLCFSTAQFKALQVRIPYNGLFSLGPNFPEW